MLITRYNERQLQLVYDAVNFEKQLTEINDNAGLFASELEADFRQDFDASPFKDAPCIICRMSYDAIEMEGDKPTEAELVKHLVEKGLTNLQAFDTEQYDELTEVRRAVTMLSQALASEQIGRVLVARLKPGGHISPHKDYGPYHDHYDRFHLCVSGDGCLFRCGQETVKMLPGEIWWFHNNDEHEVWNHSEEPRDHIIVDLKLRGDKRAIRTGGNLPAVH